MLWREMGLREEVWGVELGPGLLGAHPWLALSQLRGDWSWFDWFDLTDLAVRPSQAVAPLRGCKVRLTHLSELQGRQKAGINLNY